MKKNLIIKLFSALLIFNFCNANLYKENSFKLPTVSLNYIEIKNTGTPMLLLHGYASKLQLFEPVIPFFSKTKHVYAIDLRGHGKSGKVAGKYKIEDYAQDVDLFIRGCIKNNTIIFGQSFGGMIAIMVAAKYPELVKAIILADPPLSLRNLYEHLSSQFYLLRTWRELTKLTDKKSIISGLKNMIITKNSNKRMLNNNIASNLYGENNPWFEKTAENIMQYDADILTSVIDDFDKTFEEYKIEKLLPKIKCPVLIIRGERSYGSLISNEDMRSALKKLKTIYEVELPGVGHDIFVNNKEAVAKRILSFIAKLRL